MKNTNNINITPDKAQNASASELQGIGHLAMEAVLAVTDTVESVYQGTLPLAGVASTSKVEQRSGISRWVFQHIRNVTELVGGAIDGPLSLISRSLGSEPYSPFSLSILCALNGVLGDHLVQRNNPLAIPMQFCSDGHVLDQAQLLKLVENSNGRLLIMVHGLCMNDAQWCKDGHDHGAELARALNMTPLYLRYNTGQHISDNGQQLAELLESLTALSDKALEMNVLAHSMGGLVSRSAYHIAQNSGYQWSSSLKKLVFLGTPHHGAPLEKAGNWVDLLLGANSYTVPFARLVKIRSAGITDLRHGNVQASDWQGINRFEFTGDQRSPLPLPINVQCFAVATSVNNRSENFLGDGLVPVKSALGEHDNPTFDLSIPKHQKWVGSNINHMQLLSDTDIYLVLKNWLT